MAKINPRLFEYKNFAIKYCKYGMMAYNLHDLYVGKSLDVYGEWSEAEMHILRQVIQTGNTVLDIGANIGTHTLFFANLVGGGGKVYAFEPQRMCYQLLSTNMLLNNLLNVQTYENVVGNGCETVSVPILDPSRDNNFGALSLTTSHAGVKVPMLAIDSLALPQCHLLKIDVEGMELDVLKGAAKTLSDCRPFIYTENNRPENTAALYDLLMQFDYKAWWHMGAYYNPDNYFANEKNIFPHIVETSLFCVPNERRFETDLIPMVAQETCVEARQRWLSQLIADNNK